MDSTQQSLNLYLAAPRGFCAGVDRAIQIVERALDKFGAPVYVRHEIVHNDLVVSELREKGAVFIDELSDIPPEDIARPVVFSAHGVPKSVPEEANQRNMFSIDATCPLVSKVHRGVERHYSNGAHIVLIGHKGHVEVIGTMGQLPEGAVTLVETIEDVDALDLSQHKELAYCTQTTLSVDDTHDIVVALKAKYPHIKVPHGDDICYATTNRQLAVKDIADKSDLVLIVGSKASSNSNRLVDTALLYGASHAYLVDTYEDIDLAWFEGVSDVGISAGASAPEVSVNGVIEYIKEHFDVTVENVITKKENVEFKLPKMLRAS